MHMQRILESGEIVTSVLCIANILLVTGALLLIVGLLGIRKSSVYQKCLNAMRLCLAEEEIQE